VAERDPATSDAYTWGGYSFGWYGLLAGAFDKADIFEQFTPTQRQALARVAAGCVEETLKEPCDSTYSHGPEHQWVRCDLPRGHAGQHTAKPAKARTVEPSSTAHKERRGAVRDGRPKLAEIGGRGFDPRSPVLTQAQHLCWMGRPFHWLPFWRFLCLTCRGEQPTTYADYLAQGGITLGNRCRVCFPASNGA